jgi:hypothetical protein
MKKELINTMKYAVDIPRADNEEWICIEYFETKSEAIKFAQKTFGADKQGKINLISSL